MSKTTTDPVQELFQLVEDKKTQNISQPVSSLGEQTQISKRQVLYEIMTLEAQGKIKFAGQSSPSSSKIDIY